MIELITVQVTVSAPDQTGLKRWKFDGYARRFSESINELVEKILPAGFDVKIQLVKMVK